MEKRIFVSHKTFGIGYLLEKNKNQPVIEVNFNHQLRKINNLDGLEKNKYLILFNENFSNYIINQKYEEKFDYKTTSRGKTIYSNYDDNAIISLISPTILTGEVRGSNYDYYNVEIRFNNGFIDALCSCPVHTNCKHCYALLKKANMLLNDDTLINYDCYGGKEINNELNIYLNSITVKNTVDIFKFPFSRIKSFKEKVADILNDDLLDDICQISSPSINNELFAKLILCKKENKQIVLNYLNNKHNNSLFYRFLNNVINTYFLDDQFYSFIYDYYNNNYEELLNFYSDYTYFRYYFNLDLLKEIILDSNDLWDEITSLICNHYIANIKSIVDILIKKMPKENLIKVAKAYPSYFSNFIETLSFVDKIHFIDQMDENDAVKILNNVDYSSIDEKELIKSICVNLLKEHRKIVFQTLLDILYQTNLGKYVIPFFICFIKSKTTQKSYIKKYDNKYGEYLDFNETKDFLFFNFEIDAYKEDYHEYNVDLKIGFNKKDTFYTLSFDKNLKCMNEVVSYKNNFFSKLFDFVLKNNETLKDLLYKKNLEIEQKDFEELTSSFEDDTLEIGHNNLMYISNSMQSVTNCDLAFYFNTINSFEVKLIANGKDYLIKKLSDFVNGFIEKELISFSKKTSFLCDINNFNNHGKKMFDILNKISFDYYHQFVINESIMKEYLSLNDYIIFNYRKYYLGNDINITYKINEDYQMILEPNIGENCLIFDTFGIYFENNLFHKFKVINVDLFNLFNKYNGVNLKKDNNLLNSFFTRVYPFFKEDIVLQTQDEIKNYNKNNIDLYFDYEDNEIVVDKKITGNPLNVPIIEDFLEKLGFVNNKIIEEDKIYNFFTCDLSLLNKLANVYLSDNIKNKKIYSFERQKYHISYNNNLMEVFLEDSTYSDEELEKIFKAIKRKKSFIKLKNDTILKLDNNEAKEFYEITNDLHLDTSKLKETKKMPIYNRFKLINVDSNYPLDQYMEEVINSITSFKEKKIDFPQYKYELKQYQKEAVNWLCELKKYNFSGILADDMGLGKTFEILAFYDLDKIEEPSLIVCPKSLIFNWINEINKFVNHTEYIKIYGNGETRKDIIKNINPAKRCLYITSYDSLRNDIELYNNINFRYLFLDEAQAIKTVTAKKSISAKLIKSKYRFVLTGTPIENNILELWSIFDFLMPGYFEDLKEFKSRFENDESYKDIIYKKIALFILRRTKKEMLKELPDKFERLISTELSSSQQKIYDAYCKVAKDALEKGANGFDMLPYLTRLRQICVDPRLVDKNYQGDSAKINLLNQILDDYLPQGRKILVFSQFVEALKLIEEDLKQKNINYLMLTGSTKAEERVGLCDRFNNDKNIQIFLISIKAGGSGLNLVGADTVIHLDIWWNSAVENQATDRAYRIGQKNNVEVIKLMCENTIEEKIIELQAKKKDLIDSLISKDDKSITSISKEDIKFILD